MCCVYKFVKVTKCHVLYLHTHQGVHSVEGHMHSNTLVHVAILIRYLCSQLVWTSYVVSLFGETCVLPWSILLSPCTLGSSPVHPQAKSDAHMGPVVLSYQSYF